MLSKADRWHQGLRRYTQQTVDGHELVAFRFELWNQLGEGVNGLLPVATGIVEDDDISAGAKQAVAHIADDAIATGALVIMRIDVRTDRHVAHLPHAVERNKLFGR